MLIHRGHVLVAALPEDLLATLLLGVLVGGQGGAGILGIQMQFHLVGIVHKDRVGGLAHAVGDAGDGEGTHDEVHVHRLALDAVVGAGRLVGTLPHIVGAGVAQGIREAGDPQIVPPGVEGRVAEAGPHPVQRGIDALLPGVAQLHQPVKEGLGDGGHLLGEDAADALVLQVIVYRVGQLVGRSGVVGQALLGRGHQTQQPRHMVGLGAGLLHRGGVGVEIDAEGDAQAGALVGVAAPLVVVLGPVGLLAVPLAAVAAADDGKINARGLGLFPVHFPLEFGHVDALEHRRRDGLPAGIEVIAQIILLPGGRRGAEICLGGPGGAGSAAGQGDADPRHHQQAEQTQRQHQTAAPAAAAFAAPGFAAPRRLGPPLPGRRRGCGLGIGCSPPGAAIDLAFFRHSRKPLLAKVCNKIQTI